MKLMLREMRKKAGFKTAKSFAEHIGMSENTYRNYENGTRNLYLDVACDLCDALGCTLDELAGRETAAPVLSPRERAVVDAYRHEDATGRAAIERVCGIKSGEGGPVSREVA